MKIINKVMYFMKKNFYKFVISPLTFLMVLLINKMSIYASSLGETIKGASNTAQTGAVRSWWNYWYCSFSYMLSS